MFLYLCFSFISCSQVTYSKVCTSVSAVGTQRQFLTENVKIYYSFQNVFLPPMALILAFHISILSISIVTYSIRQQVKMCFTESIDPRQMRC
jgi:hypothetical protein